MFIENRRLIIRLFFALFPGVFLFVSPCFGFGVSSPNIPLASPVYLYLEKLAGAGLLNADIKGIRPLSRSEAARLLVSAKERMAAMKDDARLSFSSSLITELDRYLAREMSLHKEPEKAPIIDYTPFSSVRVRYINIDGTARNFERQVHDPGGDGVFGIGAGLRPDNPKPTPAQQRGSEGTPLFENNEGVRYRTGSSGDIRFTGEAYAGRYFSGLIEPQMLFSEEDESIVLRLNKGYLKAGFAQLELEVGRDEAWLGPGYRGAITLTNNSRNFDQVKLSSPEPIDFGSWGLLKYALLASRFERTITNGVERQPYFFAFKLAYKPTDNWEIGFNLGKQVGGPGVDNSVGSTLRGIVGGTNNDNSNGLGGFDIRYRATWLRNTEFFGEYSGEDTAKFWPIVESYVAGIFIPNLTADGRNDLRFEYFLGNQILYTHGTFPQGYTNYGMPIGHSQGGATQEFFLRYSHWFSARNNIALEYFQTQRGVVGKMPGQEEEQKNAWRGFWRLPIYGDWNAELMYGWERVNNFNLVPGVQQTNQVFSFELSYRF